MSISSLRAAVTAAGGTPTQYTHVGLLRQLVSAFGGTPTQYTVVGLLREAITAKGGTPNSYSLVILLRLLVTTLGGTPATFHEDALWAQIAALATAGGTTPADYTITNNGSAATANSWDNIVALGAATLSGKIIDVAPGNYPSKTIALTGQASTITFRAQDSANPPVCDLLTINGCSKLKLQGIKATTSHWSSAALSNPAIKLTGTNGALELADCTVKGSYRGDTSVNIDVSTELPEYASIAATMVGGAVTALTVTHSYVGDLMAPGTYALTLAEASGTGFSATMTVANTTLGGITGNHITGTTLTNGGSGYAMALDEALRITWAGQKRMADYLPYGIGMPSGGSIASLTVTGGTFSDLEQGIKMPCPTTTIIVEGVTFDRIYSCALSTGLTVANVPPTTTRFSWNYATNFFYISSDAGNPHGDLVHLYMNDLGPPNTPSDWANIEFIGNVLTVGSSRSSTIGFLFGDCPDANAVFRGRAIGNLLLTQAVNASISFDGLRDFYLYRNTMVRSDPADVDNVAQFAASIPVGSMAALALGKSFVGYNIFESLSIGNATTVKDVSNTIVTPNSAPSYAAVFPGYTGAKSTKADALTAFIPGASYTGKGAYQDSYLNYTTKALDRTLEPTWVHFDNLTAQTVSTSVNSSWCRVIGGPATGQDWAITGGTAQVADDASGTNATVAATSGTVDEGKFMRVNVTTSASGSATTTATLTFRGSYSYGFSATTASSASFTAVDNQATAYSSITTPPAETGLKRFLIAVKVKNDVVVSGGHVFSDNSAVTRLYMPTTSAYRFQLSSGHQHRSTLVPTTGWETHIMAVDFTQTSAAAVSKWVCNGVSVSQAAGSTIDVTGTVTRTVANLMAATFGIFADPDGTGIMDGKMEFLWMHWGDGTLTLPDITDPAVQNMFTADNINLTDGSGPLGIQPKLFYTGNAAGYNAGLANKGSVSRTLTKTAGTYA